MRASELKQILDNLSPEELELELICNDEYCKYQGDMVKAEVCLTDLVNEPRLDDDDWAECYSPERFAELYPDEEFEVYAKKGQIIISITT